MTLTPADALLAQQDWTRAAADLDAHGNAILPALLTPAQCNVLSNAYDQDDRYRSRVVMARHGFGRGEYKYFRYPSPGPIARLRGAL